MAMWKTRGIGEDISGAGLVKQTGRFLSIQAQYGVEQTSSSARHRTDRNLLAERDRAGRQKDAIGSAARFLHLAPLLEHMGRVLDHPKDCPPPLAQPPLLDDYHELRNS